MGIAVVGGLTQTKPVAGNSRQDENAAGFLGIFERKMDSASSSKSVQSKSKTHREKTGRTDEETASMEDESQNGDTAQSLFAAQVPCVQDILLAAQAGMAASPTQPPNNTDGAKADSVLPQPVENTQPPIDAVSAVGSQPEAATDQVVTNVMTALQHAGEAVQQQLQATTTPQSETEASFGGNMAAIAQEGKQGVRQTAAAVSETDAKLPESGGSTAANAETMISDNTAAQPVLAAETEEHSEPGNSNTSDPANLVRDMEKAEERIPAEMSSAPFAARLAGPTNHSDELLEVSQAIDKAIDRFQTDFQGLKAETTSIQIALEPRELGALTITLLSGANGVSAKIKTDNADVANLIGDQVHRIAQSLEAKGIRVENVDVVFSQTASENFGGGQNGAGHSDHAPVPRIIPLFASQSQPEQADALNVYESAPGYYTGEDGVGQSVEYRI